MKKKKIKFQTEYIVSFRLMKDGILGGHQQESVFLDDGNATTNQTKNWHQKAIDKIQEKFPNACYITATCV